MKKIKIQDAIGRSLCHDITEMNGEFKGVAFKRGMFRVNRQLLSKINSIGDITICTLPDHYPVEAGSRLVSMRIVPLVTKEEQILEAEQLCRDTPLLRLLPYRHKKVGVIITGSEVYHGRIQDRFEPVVRDKMKQYPSEIVGITIFDDDLDLIAGAARAYLEKGADFLIFTGGMSVDPDDLTPHRHPAAGRGYRYPWGSCSARQYDAGSLSGGHSHSGDSRGCH